MASEQYESLNREFFDGKRIVFERGKCAIDPKTFIQYSYEDGLEYLINPRIRQRIIDDGSFGPYDDRKLRVAGIWSDDYENTITFLLGVTDFKEHKRIREWSQINPEYVNALRTQAELMFGDPLAYFPRAFGLALLVFSSEGSLVLGRRTNEDEYKGQLVGIEGYVEFDDPLRLNLDKTIFNELKEEFGVERREVMDKYAIGFAQSMQNGGTGLMHVIKTKLPANYFLRDTPRPEHKDIVLARDLEDVRYTLQNTTTREGMPGHKDYAPRPLLFTTEVGLQNLRVDDFKAL